MSDSKARKLRSLIESPGCGFILEAHNGLSAKIVEEAGFPGIWGSGLSLSAAMGVRDNNEASWTQVLEVVEFMCDNTKIPILLDGDTGFGDFNNVRRLIRKLEQRDVAGVCIEDKLFPKTNSFFFGEQQPLADIEEFCGKVKAGKDSQTNPDFCLVARVEALVTGWGLEEALRRAYAYSEAGADAILMHSKSQKPDEVLAFLDAWDGQKPIVIVPTTYGVIPSKDFGDAGAALIVWANHMLRSSVTAMQGAAERINSEESILGIGADIVPVKEIFRLQNMQELKEAEKLYRPQAVNTSAVILAASRGKELGELTADSPKCMVEVDGKSLLETLVSRLNEQGIKEIQVVVGYQPETVDLSNIQKIDNPDYADAGVLQSLFAARDQLVGSVVISYGDILFSGEILRDLLGCDGDIVLTVDTAWIQGEKQGRLKDVVSCESPHSNVYLGERTSPIRNISCDQDRKDADGEWIGILKLSEEGTQALREDMDEFYNEDPDFFRKANLVDLLSRMLEKGRLLEAHYCAGHWLDVDSVQDLEYAEQLHRTLKNLRGTPSSSHS